MRPHTRFDSGLCLAIAPSTTGPEAPGLVDFIMSKDCPVSASLTDADKAKLLRIKQEALPRSRID